jgi:pyrimidine 5'-nucleotidase
LQASGHTIDFDDWHDHVHAPLPYEDHLRADPRLKDILNSIPLPKWVFTNADARHAERCLDLLDLRDCFRGVITFDSVMAAAAQNGLTHGGRPVVCKPQRQAFTLALQQACGSEAATTAFFDDSARNIAAAHHMGVYSVLVGRTGVDCACDAQVHSMHDLPASMPWLFAVGDGRPPAADLAVSSPRKEEVALEEAAPRTAVFVTS